MMKKIIFGVVGVCFSGFVFANTWESSEVKDDYLFPVDGVVLKSNTGNESLSLFRNDKQTVRMSGKPAQMVFIRFKVNGLDQIKSRSTIVYKATQGKAFSQDSLSKMNTLTGSVITPAFHGQPSETCGIVGNIIHSDKLTVRYETSGDKTIDVEFDLPKDHAPLYSFLGFDDKKDCVKVSE